MSDLSAGHCLTQRRMRGIKTLRIRLWVKRRLLSCFRCYLVLLVLPIPFQLPACVAYRGRRVECSQCERLNGFRRAEGERCLAGALGARKKTKHV
jgi:hypothetical protein